MPPTDSIGASEGTSEIRSGRSTYSDDGRWCCIALAFSWLGRYSWLGRDLSDGISARKPGCVGVRVPIALSCLGSRAAPCVPSKPKLKGCPDALTLSGDTDRSAPALACISGESLYGSSFIGGLVCISTSSPSSGGCCCIPGGIRDARTTSNPFPASLFFLPVTPTISR